MKRFAIKTHFTQNRTKKRINSRYIRTLRKQRLIVGLIIRRLKIGLLEQIIRTHYIKQKLALRKEDVSFLKTSSFTIVYYTDYFNLLPLAPLVPLVPPPRAKMFCE